MSLLDVVRSGIKLVDKTVKSLEATVTFQKCVFSDDGSGTPTYPTSVPLRAIVEWKEVQVPSSSGLINVSRPTVLFLDYNALMAATNNEGISEDDRIFLPDGTTGPTRNLEGFLDAQTGQTMYTQVYLG